MRILFVENHQVFADTVIAAFLSDDEVTVVPTLRAALALDANTFDVALVDYDLDDVKGDAVVRELRRASPLIPIVAVSSHADGNAALLAAGANAACPKAEFAKRRSMLTELSG